VAASAELAVENAGLEALLARLERSERAVLGGLARFRRPFAESACPAVARALGESDSGGAVRIWRRLSAVGLVAPTRTDVRRLGGDGGEALWHVPHLVRGELPEIREPQSEVDAAAARHLLLRIESEGLSGLERLDLYEAIVEHGIDGRGWGLAGVAALEVLTPLTHLGEWRRGRDLGDSWLARARNASDTLSKALFEASVVFRLAALHRLLGEPETARGLLEQALKGLRWFQEQPVDDEEIRQIRQRLSRVTYELAILDENQGHNLKARAHLQESLVLDKELGDLAGYSASLNLLAILDIRECRYDEAKAHLEEALPIQMELGDMKGYAAALHQLAIVDENQGRYEDARARFQESLDLKEGMGDVQGYAASLHQLAILDWHEGLYEESRVRLQESLDLKKRIGDLKGYAASLHQLAILAENQGRYVEARERLQQSLEILKKLGSLRDCSASLHQLGILDGKQGRHDEARAHFQESLDMDRKLGNLQGVAASLHHLAILARNESRYEDARSYLQQSLDIFQGLRDPQGYSKTLHELGSTAVATGNIDEAERHWRASIEIKERLGDTVGVAMTKLGLGQVRLLKDPDEALGLLEAAVSVLREKGRDELKQAEAILKQAVELFLRHIGTTLAKAKNDAARAVVHYWRGICYRLLDDESEARKNLETSLKLSRRLAQPAAVRAIRAQLARLNRNVPENSK
jgi:tetratricopeptide (TPR) repeat protein